MNAKIPCYRCTADVHWLIHDGLDSKLVCKEWPNCTAHSDSEESKVAKRYAEIVAAEEPIEGRRR